MALLSVQVLSSLGGTTTTLSPAANDGDTFVNSGRELLYAQNFDTLPHTITVAAAQPCSLGDYHPITFTLPTGVTRNMGPFSRAFYADPSGFAHLTYDAATALTIGVIGPY